MPQTMSIPRSRQTEARLLFSRAAWEGAFMSSQRSAVRSGFSPSRVSLPAFPLTERGSLTASRNRPASNSMWRRPLAAQPRQVAAGFYLAQAPVWSPDGGYLLFWGQRDRDAPPENNVDWYVAPVTGGPPVRTQARSVLLRQGFQAFHGLPTPDGWVDAEAASSFMGALATRRTRGRWLFLPRHGKSLRRRGG